RGVAVCEMRRQAAPATPGEARRRAAGRLGRLTSFVYRTSGRQAATADPGRHLLRWRERGGIGPAVDSVREALSAPILDAPAAIRPALAAALDVSEIRLGLESTLDRAIGGIGSLEPP